MLSKLLHWSWFNKNKIISKATQPITINILNVISNFNNIFYYNACNASDLTIQDFKVIILLFQCKIYNIDNFFFNFLKFNTKLFFILISND